MSSADRTLSSETIPLSGHFRIDYFYQRQHRRLRERYGLATVERHENWVMRALEKRHVK